MGIYRLDRATDLLSEVFEPDTESYDERPSGESAVAAFAVDEHGRAIDDSNVLSTCAWAVARVLREGPDQDWLAGFQRSSVDFSREWRDFVTAAEPRRSQETKSPPQPNRRVLNGSDLVKCLCLAVTATGIAADLPHSEIRVQSKIVARRAKRRLYVIGNRQAWGTQRYFGTLARRLPDGS